MEIRIVEKNNIKIALAHSDEPVVADGQSALEFLMEIGYAYDCRIIAVNKAAFAEDFFRLSTGVAGEVAQKIVNYRYRLAVVGDFSGYQSKPLHDYIYECNNGGHLFFVATEEEALEKLTG